MLVNATNLSLLYQGFKTSFNGAFTGTPVHWDKIAMKVNSSVREEKYGWLGQFPQMREWIGGRVIQNLTLHDYSIKNRKFEVTIAVKREDIEDDQYGVHGPMFEELGRNARLHPDEQIFDLLSAGFTTIAYDGQNFFDTDHRVLVDGAETSVSNMQAGAENPWYLIDGSRALKPLVYQERVPYDLQRIDRENDERVFMEDEYLYGVRARMNAGLGLWQLAFASKAELNAANYAAARAAMMAIPGDEGRKLGIMPTHLVVGPSNEARARQLLKNGTRVETVSATPVAIANEWMESAELIVTPNIP